MTVFDAMFAETNLKQGNRKLQKMEKNQMVSTQKKTIQNFNTLVLEEHNAKCEKQTAECQETLFEAHMFNELGKTIIEQKLKLQDTLLDSVKEHLNHTLEKSN